MGLDLGKIGGMAAGLVGNAMMPGVGGMIGQLAGSGFGAQIWGAFQGNPGGGMGNPLVSAFIGMAAGNMGLPTPQFGSLTRFAQDAGQAIANVLQNGFDQTVRPADTSGQTSPDQGLSTNGKDTIDTGRYLISGQENQLKIFDKQTNTWVQAQGDPHLSTSDGDRAQFQQNLAIDLPDGTKVKIKTTPQNAQGVALLDSVAVMKGNEAVMMTGFSDGAAGVNTGHVLNNADSVDNQWQDGTVLRAGAKVDDLTFAADGKEIVGGDPNARFGEINLDGHGGASVNRPNVSAMQSQITALLQKIMSALTGQAGGADAAQGQQGAGAAAGAQAGAAAQGADATQGADAAQGAGATQGADAAGGADGTDAISSGGSIYDKIFEILAKLQKNLEGKVNKMAGMDPQKDKAEMDKLGFQVQQLQQMQQTLLTMATNMSKTEHEGAMSIVKNFA